MSFRNYLYSMIVASLVAWVGVAAIIVFVRPSEADGTGIALLYTSIFLAVVGTLALLGISIRTWLFPRESRATQVSVAFRQSILFAVLVDGILFLSHAQLVRWWIIVSFIILLTALEFLFISLFAARHVSGSQRDKEASLTHSSSNGTVES